MILGKFTLSFVFNLKRQNVADFFSSLQNKPLCCAFNLVWILKLLVRIHELRVWIHELRVRIHELRVWIHDLRVPIHKLRVQVHELRVRILELQVESMSYESESTRYDFKSTSYGFKSRSPRTIKSMKTEVNSSKSFSFPKIINSKLFDNSFPKIIGPKLFGNSWGNFYVQFLVIISCFTFPPLHSYGFERLTLKDDFGKIHFFLCF